MVPAQDGPDALSAPPEELDDTYLLRCAGCGYSLRGLSPESKCPECGLRIRDSLAAAARGRQPWLGAAARRVRQWIQRPVPALARNSRTWLRTVALAPLALAGLVPLLVGWAWWRETVLWPARVPEYPLVWMTGAFAAATWLLTRPDRLPQRPVDPLWTSIRWALRVVSLTPVAAAALAAYSETVPATQHPRYAAQAAALFPLTPVIAFLLFDYLSYLAARAWSEWTAWFFRASMLLVTPVVALWVKVELDEQGRSSARLLYPDAISSLVEFAVSGWGCAGVYTGILCAAFVRLAAALWVLPDEPVKE